MKIQRRSTWDSKRSEWYHDAAKNEARETVGFGAVMLAVAGVLFTIHGATEWNTWIGAGSIVLGIASAALGVGLWWGHKWAVRVGGIMLICVAVAGVIGLPVALLLGHSMDVTDLLLRGFLLVSIWNSALSLIALSKKPIVPDRPGGDESRRDEPFQGDPGEG